MNFGLFLFFQFFLHSSNVEIYKSIKTCVFNYLQRFPVSSVLKCAPKCYLMNCNGFQFNGNYCYFYGDGGTCQSDTPCEKVSIFVNDKVRIFQLSWLLDFYYYFSLRQIKWDSNSSFSMASNRFRIKTYINMRFLIQNQSR